jgi:hypothetical protein
MTNVSATVLQVSYDLCLATGSVIAANGMDQELSCRKEMVTPKGPETSGLSG